MLQAIRPTSKSTLKMQCLFVCKGDIDEASRLYDYFAKDMPELPDYDPVQPTWVDSTKDVAGSFVKWIGNNRNGIMQGYEIIRAMTGKSFTATDNARHGRRGRSRRRTAAAYQRGIIFNSQFSIFN